MAYAECGSLFEFLHGSEQREYTMAMAIDWMIQCIQGINHMHSMEPILIHRDLKTANLLLTKNYRNLKIGDFGNATDLGTMMTDMSGTAGYIAPKVLLGNTYTEKCDIYSFGIVLWEVMARRKPFHHLSDPNTIAKMYLPTKDERPILFDIIPNCEKFRFVIENCWDQEPKNRPTVKEIQLTDIPCLNIIMRP
ncbi:putative mitogen-activated protein kinase kinase kinase 7-like [Drosophila mojavensis]|uniref:putative mitogen-activated protein kinase kinase kinase 7-like n=1 Tax=Drosophila mojavensis TaxID=7230 RepID=UPI0013EEA5FD|nr:putative mitogen-activated protein kinase kinase kinase 7-like [Drosophila mojavensis]